MLVVTARAVELVLSQCHPALRAAAAVAAAAVE
jgi:hypothetical protein